MPDDRTTLISVELSDGGRRIAKAPDILWPLARESPCRRVGASAMAASSRDLAESSEACAMRLCRMRGNRTADAHHRSRCIGERQAGREAGIGDGQLE